MGSCGVVAAVAVEFNRLKKGGSMQHKQSVQIGHATRRAWTRGAVVVAALTLAAGAQADDYAAPGIYAYNVPAGVTSITVRVVGGGGGGGGYDVAGGFSGAGGAGGAAADVSAVIAVTPLSTVSVFVGAGGGRGTSDSDGNTPAGGMGGTGGFAGGTGGLAGTSGASGSGGGGGGSSAVSVAGNVVQAGGGGGLAIPGQRLGGVGLGHQAQADQHGVERAAHFALRGQRPLQVARRQLAGAHQRGAVVGPAHHRLGAGLRGCGGIEGEWFGHEDNGATAAHGPCRGPRQPATQAGGILVGPCWPAR